MAVGTATALLIGYGINAGVSAINAKRQSDAAKDAAATQTASADKAIDLQRQMFEQRRADMAPFMGYGSAAMGTLGASMGLTPAPIAPSMTSAAGGGRSTTGATRYPDGTTGRIAPPDAPIVGHAKPRTGTLADAMPIQAAARQQTASSMAPAGAVRMQTPDGRIVMVPADRAAEAQQMGGRVVQ